MIFLYIYIFLNYSDVYELGGIRESKQLIKIKLNQIGIRGIGEGQSGGPEGKGLGWCSQF
jgi:hypothetical protein